MSHELLKLQKCYEINQKKVLNPCISMSTNNLEQLVRAFFIG